MIVRAALLLLFACGSTASPRPPAATHADAEPPIATATHSCSDAALGIENATKSVRDPDRAVFETLRRHCLDDRWPARAIDCFATMAEGDLGTCAHDLPDATLPWDRVSELAQKQGIGEADVVWDLTAGMPPAPPRRRAVRKTALVKREKPPA